MPEYKNSIEKAALGRVAELGDMYDARSDTFCGTSILKKRPEGSVLHQIDNHHSNIMKLVNDKQKDRFHKLGVDAELHMSFLSGKIKLDGAAHYLNEETKSARTTRSSFVYNIHTVVQKLQISDEKFQSFIQYNSLKSTNATHVVVQVDYGAAATLSLQADVGNNEDKTEVGASLSAVLDFKAVKIDASATVDIKAKDTEKFNKFNFTIQADFLVDGKMPATIDEALELIRRVPELVKKNNEGRGKPQKYILLPLSTLCEYLNIGEIKADNLLKSIDEAIINDYVNFFEDFSEYMGQLYDIQESFKVNKDWIPDEEINKITTYINDLKSSEQEFKSKLGLLLTEVRSGTRPISSLEEQLGQYKTNQLSFKKIQLYMNGLHPLVQKIDFFHMLKKEEVQILPRDGNLQQKFMENGAAEQYIIFSKEATEKNLEKIHLETMQLFFNELRRYKLEKDQKKTDAKIRSETVFVLVDLAVNPKLTSICKETTIKIYKEGVYTCEDFKAQHDLNKTSNFCVSPDRKSYKPTDIPKTRVVLEIPCPNLGVCFKCESVKWRCEECKGFVEYDFKNTFYCPCSTASASTYEFRCSDLKHGPLKKKFENQKVLADYLARLRTSKVLTIMLLGPVGVGKSTWINGIVNYLTFSSLEEAAQSELGYMIPSNFTVLDSFRKEQQVKVGESSTDGNNFYTIPDAIGETAIRFLDTPGIGHPDGVERDIDNFNRVIDNLSTIDELHGICILVKPDDNRVDQQFRYVLETIMARLPKTAIDNIVFCVTHSAEMKHDNRDMKALVESTFRAMQVSDLGSLADTIVYTLDNEPFRYLCTLRYPNVKTPLSKMDSLKKSWEQSRSETLRLCQHLKRYINPCKTADIVNLNDALNFVYYTNLPIGEIQQKNQNEYNRIMTTINKLRYVYLNGALCTKRDNLLRYLDYLVETSGSASKTSQLKQQQADVSAAVKYLCSGGQAKADIVNVREEWNRTMDSIQSYKGPMTSYMNDSFLGPRTTVNYRSATHKLEASKSAQMDALTNEFRSTGVS